MAIDFKEQVRSLSYEYFNQVSPRMFDLNLGFDLQFRYSTNTGLLCFGPVN